MDVDEFLDKESELIENEPLEEHIPEEEAEKRAEGHKDILKKISNCISKNELDHIERIYSALWVEIGDEKYTWKKDLYESLIALNKELEPILKNMERETKEKISSILNLIAKARVSLKQGRVEPALSIHSEITAAYNKIPAVFEGEKKKIYMENITPFNNELRRQVDKDFLHNFDSGVSKINHLISSVKAELQKGDVEEAAKFYTDCIHSYNSLPEGFFLKKLEESNKLLELYKELSITLEISELNSKLKSIPPKNGFKVRGRHLKRLAQEKDKHYVASLKKEIESMSSKLKEQKENYEQALAHEEKGNEKGIKRLTADYKKNRLRLNRPLTTNHRKKPLHLRSPHTETHKPRHLEKPKSPKPREKSGRKCPKISSLKEELIKRKIERAQFEISRGYVKEANKDLHEALRIDSENKKAKELLESLNRAGNPSMGKTHVGQSLKEVAENK